MSGLLAEAFGGAEYGVGGLCPAVVFWVLIVAGNEAFDVCFELAYGCMDAPLQLFAGEFGEPAFDLVDPGGGRWRKVDVVVRPAREPCWT